MDTFGGNTRLVEKWEPALEGIQDDYVRRTTAQLLENQAKQIVSEKLNEAAVATGTTTVGQLGTFQKFAFPLVRRVYPELIANKIVGVQPMQGPVSQIFYLGNSRVFDTTVQTVYSKYNLTYRGLAADKIGNQQMDHNSVVAGGGVGGPGSFAAAATGGSGLDLDVDGGQFDLTSVLGAGNMGLQHSSSGTEGQTSSTFGGKIAGWPQEDTIQGWSVSAGEALASTGIPELQFHIQQQAVVAGTRKMRALWTLEASQDLKAYHNLDLERELTDLLSKELSLEIDREILENLRMLAYGLNGSDELGNWKAAQLDNGNPNAFKDTSRVGPGTNAVGTNSGFVPSSFTYDQNNGLHFAQPSDSVDSNVYVMDFTQSSLSFNPRHVGETYANLLALINMASQDIYRTTHRGPGTVIITSPLIASFLESSAKLEGGIENSDKPTNMGSTIAYKGRFAGKYELYVDPLWPEDEILIGYKGANAMDAGFVYAPYIPLQQLPTITDPESFQPRKGILTRYGMAAITPAHRFYRVLRIVGPNANYLTTPFARNASVVGTQVTGYE